MTGAADGFGAVWREANGHKPETFSASELLAKELPPVRFAVPGIVPEGVTLLGGKPKMRKTFLVLGICLAVATGGKALGAVPVERGTSLYIGLEENERRLHKRLRSMLSGSERTPDDLHVALEWPRLDEGGAEALDEWLEEHPDTRVVVFDTLAKVRPRQPGRNVYAEDYGALEELVPLAAKHRVAIVVVHHTRKMAAADPLDEISGSTGLTGGADGMLVLKRDRGQADAYLTVTGRDIEEERELALRWDAKITGWSLAGDAEEYRLSDARQQIVQTLEKAGSAMSPKEIAEATGKSDGSVKVLLGEMVKAGQVVN